jgi:hypothetical protein
MPSPASAPVPRLVFVDCVVKFEMVLLLILKPPVPPLFSIPLKVAVVELELLDAFLIIFGNTGVPIVITPVALLRIPQITPMPELMPNVVPVLDKLAPVVRLPVRKLGSVVFPIVLPEISKFPNVPIVLMPVIPPLIVALVPIASRAPMVLLRILIVFTVVAQMPTIAPPEPVVAAYIEPLPVAAPMVLPVTVPIFTLPELMFIPQKIPLVVAAVLLVYNANPAIVLF